jgi:hypothetical protein
VIIIERWIGSISHVKRRVIGKKIKSKQIISREFISESAAMARRTRR